jgi:putative DNA primase/helicase
MKYDHDIIERAREADILSVALRYTQLKKSGQDHHGPCPVCGGTDRFSVTPRKGRGVFFCRVCDVGGDAIKLVEHVTGCNFRDAVETLTGEDFPRARVTNNIKRQETDEDQDARRLRNARYCWHTRKPPQGTIVETYLRGRGQVGAIPPTIGYLPGGKYPPAMVTAFGMPIEPEPGEMVAQSISAVHLTSLADDGSYRLRVEGAKKILGFASGLPIVLASVNDLGGLAITEGIEDGLSVLATGLGVWVAGNAGLLPKLADIVPDFIEAVTIFAHDDTDGERKARELADLLVKRGFEVRVDGLP